MAAPRRCERSREHQRRRRRQPWQRDDDNPEREAGRRQRGRQASSAWPSDRAGRVRQRVSFSRAAKFTRADTCASPRQTGIVNEGIYALSATRSSKALRDDAFPPNCINSPGDAGIIKKWHGGKKTFRSKTRGGYTTRRDD